MAERKNRTKEERLAEIDSKLKFHSDAIEKLNKKKEAILNPKPRKRKITSVNTVVKLAKDSGMSADEIAKKLGLKLEN